MDGGDIVMTDDTIRMFKVHDGSGLVHDSQVPINEKLLEP